MVANGPYSKGMDVQTHTPSVSIKHTLYVLAQCGRAGAYEVSVAGSSPANIKLLKLLR